MRLLLSTVISLTKTVRHARIDGQQGTQEINNEGEFDEIFSGVIVVANNLWLNVETSI